VTEPRRVGRCKRSNLGDWTSPGRDVKLLSTTISAAMLLAVRDDVWIMRAPNAPGRSFFNDPIHGRSAMLTIALHLLQSNSSAAH